MEEFLAQPLSYWVPGRASVTSLHATRAWPPSFLANGLTPCVRAWGPCKGTSSKMPEFESIAAVCALDGSRKACAAIQGTTLAVGDASPDGLVSIWDTVSWARVQTFKAGQPITALRLNEEYLAVGTASGRAIIWQRSDKSSDEWQALGPGTEGLQVDPACSGRPCDILCLGHAPDGTSLLVTHSAASFRVSVWRLPTCQPVASFARAVSPETAPALAVETNVIFSFMEGSTLITVSWLQGHDPLVQVMDVLTRETDRLAAADRLVGRGKPLAADWGGKLFAIGFEDGALAVFGYHGWLRWHRGAVGAVQVLTEHMQVVSGGADGMVMLWSGQGDLLACIDIGFQVTALTYGTLFVLAGGSCGEVQLVLLLSKDAAQERSPPPDTIKAQGKPDKAEQYVLYFDSRPSKGGVKGVNAAVVDRPDDYAAFAGPAMKPITPDELLAASVTAAGNGLSQEAQEQKVADLAEAKKHVQMKQMGEDGGVARSSGIVSLASNTSRIGRKCDSSSCMIREGLGGAVFKRCSACKSVLYCSVHCQKTHYRDSHKSACVRLGEEFKQGLQDLRKEAARERAEENQAQGAGTATGSKDATSGAAIGASRVAATTGPIPPATSQATTTPGGAATQATPAAPTPVVVSSDTSALAPSETVTNMQAFAGAMADVTLDGNNKHEGHATNPDVGAAADTGLLGGDLYDLD